MALTTKPRAGELYVCVESYVDAGSPETPGYSRGLRLDGGHPAVQKHWRQYWLPASTPDDELVAARTVIWTAAGAGPVQ
jgi:hypothetical protein